MVETPLVVTTGPPTSTTCPAVSAELLKSRVVSGLLMFATLYYFAAVERQSLDLAVLNSGDIRQLERM